MSVGEILTKKKILKKLKLRIYIYIPLNPILALFSKADNNPMWIGSGSETGEGGQSRDIHEFWPWQVSLSLMWPWYRTEQALYLLLPVRTTLKVVRNAWGGWGKFLSTLLKEEGKQERREDEREGKTIKNRKMILTLIFHCSYLSHLNSHFP